MEENIISKIKDIYNGQSKKAIIYINGENGVGKTYLVKKILQKVDNLNAIWYNSMNCNDIIDILANKDTSTISILSYFKKHIINNILIIDDFSYRIQQHKTLLTTIIQYIKRSNKCIPVVIINTLDVNKKINYIKKYSYLFTLYTPDTSLIKKIILEHIPDISEIDMYKLYSLTKNNLCKLMAIIPLYHEIIEDYTIEYNSLMIVDKLLTNTQTLNEYYKLIPESDRTTISLIYHENCIRLFPADILLYSSILDNYTLSDYLDRYIYQKQLWELSEWTNLIKLFSSNYLIKDKSSTITSFFTKILTKYAIEYSNKNFIIKLCQDHNCKKNELIYSMKEPPERLIKMYAES